MSGAGNTLLVIERAHRGAVESQFANVLFFVRELHRQSGGVDVVLRGLAAGFAVRGTFRSSLPIAGRMLESLPDPQCHVRGLIQDGATVWVEEPDLAALGPSARERLLPGVSTVAAHEITSRWSTYGRVWFF
jgi:hypothetical protein